MTIVSDIYRTLRAGAARHFSLPVSFRATITVCILVAVTLVTSSCSAKPGEPLRIGIMADIDSLPFMVAESEGLLAKAGPGVELVRFINAQERDAAMMAGQLDGVVSDVLAAALMVAGGFDVKITSATDGRYGLVARPGSTAAAMADMAGAKVGMSINTIIQYAVDRMYTTAGITDPTGKGAYEAVAIPKMPVRMEMLVTGQVDAAGLPEPFLTAAVQRGGILIAGTDALGIDAGIMLFRSEVIGKRLADIKAMYEAYDTAAQLIVAAPDSYRTFMVEKASFPAEVRDAFRFVRYRRPTMPATGQVQAALDWLDSHKLLKSPVTADSLMDGRAVARWSK